MWKFVFGLCLATAHLTSMAIEEPSYEVQFVLPKGITLATAPEPGCGTRRCGSAWCR